MQRLRFYISESTNPYRNLAAEELLLRRASDDEVILYLWQNADTVVIGRNQNPWRECHLNAMQEAGTKLARRLSGGGAVYHDLGNQNFTFITTDRNYDLNAQYEVILLALRGLGIQAERSGRNDVLVDGRKVSGSAFHRSGGNCYHHGTLLVNTDFSEMRRYLNPSPQKLAGKGVSSVVSRVGNLVDICPNLTTLAVSGALLAAFSEVYHCPLVEIMPAELPAREWDAKTRMYASDLWRLQTRVPYTAHFMGKLSFGEVEVQLALEAGLIQVAQVYSDALDADWIETVGRALQGCPFQTDAVTRVIFAVSGGQTPAAREMAAFITAEMQVFDASQGNVFR